MQLLREQREAPYAIAETNTIAKTSDSLLRAQRANREVRCCATPSCNSRPSSFEFNSNGRFSVKQVVQLKEIELSRSDFRILMRIYLEINVEIRN